MNWIKKLLGNDPSVSSRRTSMIYLYIMAGAIAIVAVIRNQDLFKAAALVATFLTAASSLPHTQGFSNTTNIDVKVDQK